MVAHLAPGGTFVLMNRAGRPVPPPLLLPLPVSLLYTHSLPPQALRRWDRAVRARKFAERVRHAERTMLQANKEHWACVARVHTECVRLTEEVG